VAAASLSVPLFKGKSHYDAIATSRCDSLFIHVGDGRWWFIPTDAVDGRSGLMLGGPKCAEFEVDPGDRLPARGAAKSSVES
jgi:hypothetical protein